MNELAVFGDPARFEIAVRWTPDGEPRARRPAAFGWSMGDLRLTIGGKIISRSQRGAVTQSHVSWYLAPFFEWLAGAWIELLHEEDFAWLEKTAAPAVIACHAALARSIALRDEPGKRQYREAQAWYRRHALRAAAEGGLFPDLFIRRLIDDVELSWTTDPPTFAPDGFVFVGQPGLARLPVADVAQPLWHALSWAAASPPAGLTAADRERHRALAVLVDRIRSRTATDFDRAYAPAAIIDRVRERLIAAKRPDLIEEDIRAGRPFVDVFSPAVAMFGGVSPHLGSSDVVALQSILIDTAGKAESSGLAALVSPPDLSAVGLRPHEDGYRLAEEFLEKAGAAGADEFVDVRALCSRLGIEVIERALQTDTIRGVALAGKGVRPTIVINTTSAFNANEPGKRFTIAHELCHIVHDRSRARRATIVSGPWVSPAIEKRANAFGAWLLMPRVLLLRYLGGSDSLSSEAVARVAERLQVSASALVEHLYNMDLIAEWDRERLRAALRKPSPR